MSKVEEAQKWVDDKYSKKEDIRVSEEDKDLAGPLKIEGFKKLKSISLKKLKITSLDISNCPYLTNVDLSELTELTSLFVNDCPKLSKLDFSHSQLAELTELDVSNLSELDCSNTSIEKLSLNLCPDIIKINCSNNNNLTGLDVSNCTKLEFLNCSRSKLTSLDLSNCPKSNDPPNLDITRKKENIRNLLIVGHTGCGKSTLCNVLTNTKAFNESERSVSTTKSFQKKTFDLNGMKYCVVDTVGVGNTGLTKKKVLYRIVEGIYSVPEGISRVLFVIDDEFSAEEIKTFKLFRDFIFEIGILKYVTIVRTKFSNFNNKEACKNDRNTLYKKSNELRRDIIYVDNPPIDIIKCDDDDDVYNSTIRIHSKMREKSRIVLLNYLEKVCQENYKLRKQDELYAKITKYINGDFEKLPAIYGKAEYNSTSNKLNIDKKVRDLLIVGRTDCGKSALANVLTETEDFKEKESEYAYSETVNFQKEDFEWKGINYSVMDIIGIWNIEIIKNEVLDKIKTKGMSQVLFVIDGKFSDVEISTLNSFENDIFESGYITIVRTKFSNFKNNEQCKIDKNQLCKEIKIIDKIVNSYGGIIYVDNPPINILDYDDGDDEDKEERIRINKKTREKSREIILTHLEKVYQEKEKYQSTLIKLVRKLTGHN